MGIGYYNEIKKKAGYAYSMGQPFVIKSRIDVRLAAAVVGSCWLPGPRGTRFCASFYVEAITLIQRIAKGIIPFTKGLGARSTSVLHRLRAEPYEERLARTVCAASLFVSMIDGIPPI